MSQTRRNRLFNNILLGMWAMITAVLVFMVLLLFAEVSLRETQSASRNPAATPPATALRAPATAAQGSEEDFVLYFGGVDGSQLYAETRRLRRTTSTVENARTALAALIDGPRTAPLPVIPGGVQLRAVYLLERGQAVIDLSRELVQELPRSAAAEALFAQAIAHTMTHEAIKGNEESAIRSVLILLEGAPMAESFDTHLDFSGPIYPAPEYAAAAR